MTNQDRNIRTLIACFVIALFALVPLRIIESQSYVPQDTMVLGEESYYEQPVVEEIVEEDDYVEEVVIEEEIIEEGEMVLGEEVELPSAEILE